MPMIDPERAAHMESLASQLDDTVDRLNAALDRQTELAAEIRDVRRRNMWLVLAVSATLLVAVGAVVAGLTAFNNAADLRKLNAAQEADRQRTDEQLCERAVVVRDDNRSMWLWLIDRVAGTSELAPEARTELDQRLPRLACSDGFTLIPAP